MTSGRYVAITPKGRITSFSETVKNNQIVGGEVPLLLKNLIKTPIQGSGLESGKSNVMVGMITQPSTPSTPSTSSSKGTTGGELLNSLQKLRFGKGKGKRSESNIRFVF
jgi:hypothetical protein